MEDKLLHAGVAFLIVIWAAFFVVFFLQYCRMEPGTERIVVLATRTALFLPLYALFMFISLAKPEALAALTIPASIVEAYSFYGFFVMIVTNLGGPMNAVAAFKGSGRELVCCTPCCPSDHLLYYKKTQWALFHFMVTRNIVVVVAAIAFYTHSKAGQAVNALLSLAATVLLFYCLVHIVLFYENLFDANRNLFGILKFFLLKFSIGLIVLQGLVCQFLITFGGSPYGDDDQYDQEEQTIRGYCILVLLEYVVLTIPYLMAFGYKITVSEAVSNSQKMSEPVVYTFGKFVCEVLKVHDVFGVLNVEEEANLTSVAA